MEKDSREKVGLKYLKTTLFPVGATWAICGLAYFFAGRPITGVISVVVGALTIALANSKRFAGKGPEFFAVWATAFSAVGFIPLALLTGQGQSPFLWILPVLPAYAFYFLSQALAITWTGVAIGIIALVHGSENFLKVQPEALPGTTERGAYQVLMVLLISLISYVVKSLALGHVKAVRKAKEEAEIAARSKGRFIDHISHEMRHTLSAIIGTFELVDPEGLPSDQRSIFTEAKDSAGLLTKLIDSTLLMTTIEDGRFEPKLEPFYLEKFCGAMREAFRERFKVAKVELSLEGNGEFRLQGDRSSLEYLLTVFLDNALKATPEGGKVEATLNYANGKLRASVQDTGCGMSPEMVSRLHEPFTRDEGLDARKQRGFGLSLATASLLVDALSGEWGAESEVGNGSKIWIEIPCQDLGVTVGKAWEDKKPESEIRLLMVDDDPTCRKVTGRILERLGYQVETCDDGKQALEKIANTQFDLVFMDCNMPVLDGFEATKYLRKKGYSKPIIALTANTTEEDKRRCSDCGMNQVLGKPATGTKLKGILTEYL